jgi:stage III sporulation protein AH
MGVSRKLMTLTILVVTVMAVWWLVDMNRDMFDIISPNPPSVPSIVPGQDTADPDPNLDGWDLNDFKAFFVEYRLQRDRVRTSEVEMLNQMVDNTNISEEGKKQAEEQLLALIDMMEKELLVENMLKAHGFKDAVFFYRGNVANVVVQAEELTEQEFMQIVEMVSSATGVSMEHVTVVEHSER